MLRYFISKKHNYVYTITLSCISGMSTSYLHLYIFYVSRNTV